MKIVLKVQNLEVLNIQKNRRLPRRYSIDGMSFDVEQEERIIIVGGRGAGKDTLKDALLNKKKGVSVHSDYEIIEPPKDNNFSRNQIIIKNGFFTRDQFHKNSDERVDPDAPKHWTLLRKAKEAGCTFIAIAEIDKLESDKSGEFSRIIIIDMGRIVADTKEQEFKKTLSYWITHYARERYISLRQDCQILKTKFDLKLENSDWLNK